MAPPKPLMQTQPQESINSEAISRRKKQYENLPNVESPHLSMQEADYIREKKYGSKYLCIIVVACYFYDP